MKRLKTINHGPVSNGHRKGHRELQQSKRHRDRTARQRGTIVRRSRRGLHAQVSSHSGQERVVQEVVQQVGLEGYRRQVHGQNPTDVREQVGSITEKEITMAQTTVEWLEEELADKLKLIILNNDFRMMEKIFEQAKQMEDEKTYETKAFWYGRGIHAGRNNMIEELKPTRP